MTHICNGEVLNLRMNSLWKLVEHKVGIGKRLATRLKVKHTWKLLMLVARAKYNFLNFFFAN